MKLISLLHLSEATELAVNLGGNISAIATYIKCAALCQASAVSAGASVSLVTNQLGTIRAAAQTLGVAVPFVEERMFERTVPAGISFYSAHFKLDLIAAIGRGEFGPVAGLIDIDTVFIRHISGAWTAQDGLFVYDITAQILDEYGRTRVRADLERVAGRPIPEPRWFGGELLIGSASSCAALSGYIEACWPNYLEAIGSLHHIGDEMVVSAAINLALLDGVAVADMGATNQVTRWWTARTGYKQIPFTEACGSTLLHLPSDKPFLASQATHPFDPTIFLDRYRRYARRKLIARRLCTPVDVLRGRKPKHVARLA